MFTVGCMLCVFEMFLNFAHKLILKDALSLGNAQLLLRDLCPPVCILVKANGFWRGVAKNPPPASG
jgi:hypothetical protein